MQKECWRGKPPYTEVQGVLNDPIGYMSRNDFRGEQPSRNCPPSNRSCMKSIVRYLTLRREERKNVTGDLLAQLQVSPDKTTNGVQRNHMQCRSQVKCTLMYFFQSKSVIGKEWLSRWAMELYVDPQNESALSFLITKRLWVLPQATFFAGPRTMWFFYSKNSNCQSKYTPFKEECLHVIKVFWKCSQQWQNYFEDNCCKIVICTSKEFLTSPKLMGHPVEYFPKP